jgi:hypothetical protein
MTVRPVVAGMLQMVLESTLTVLRARTELVEKDTIAYRSKMWICTHDVWILWDVRYAYVSTEYMNFAKRGRSFLGVDRQGHQFF